MVDALTESEISDTLESLELVVQQLEDEYAGRSGDVGVIFGREIDCTKSVVRGMLSMCESTDSIANKFLDLLNRLMEMERHDG